MKRAVFIRLLSPIPFLIAARRCQKARKAKANHS